MFIIKHIHYSIYCIKLQFYDILSANSYVLFLILKRSYYDI